MKKIFISTVLLFSILAFSSKSYGQDEFPVLAGTYLGQKPPCLMPKLFDPKIVSPEGKFDAGWFSPDMKEFYFTRRGGKDKKRTFFVIRYENKCWGNESETDIKWPHFSADGNIMYSGKEYRERTDKGWSAPKSLGEILKQTAHGLSVSANGTYYFPLFEHEKEFYSGHGKLSYSRLINGQYESPGTLSKDINTGKWIAHPYIAPDESFLIWDVVREGGYGQSDLYISFKQENGSWVSPINMGPQINTDFQESTPQVTHDGKYLFFSRGDWKVEEDGSRHYVSKKYWVDTKVIDNLKPKNNT